MTLEQAIKDLLESDAFKEAAKKDAKLRVYAGRIKKEGPKSMSARDLLLQFGYIENYEKPKPKK